MGVRIAVLSGPEQGRSQTFRDGTFTIGTSENCDFRLASPTPSAPEISITFYQREDGWYAKTAGTGTLINSTPASETNRVRSGDVFRLSQNGPAFAFHLDTRKHPGVLVPGSPPSISESSVPPGQVDELVTQPDFSRVRWASLALAAGICLLAIGIIVYALRPDTPKFNDVAVSKSVPADAQPARESDTKQRQADLVESAPLQANPSIQEGSESTDLESETDPVPDQANSEVDDEAAEAATEVDPWHRALEILRPSIYLLAVEQPKTGSTWPVATATAIHSNMLLTSGSAVSELAKMRDQGWTLWAINESSQTKLKITSLRQHLGFSKSNSEPERRIYFDLGLVQVEGMLPAHAELASREELTGVEQGMPLGCVGIMREIELLNRFDSNEPELQLGKVFIVTALPPAPGPRLAHFRAALPHKPYGSPLVDSAGKIYTVSAESAVMPEETGAGLNLHYAPILDRDILDAGLEPSGGNVWIDLLPSKP